MVSLREPLRRPPLLIYQLMTSTAGKRLLPMSPSSRQRHAHRLINQAIIREEGIDGSDGRSSWNFRRAGAPCQADRLTRKSILNLIWHHGRKYKGSLHRASAPAVHIQSGWRPYRGPTSPVLTNRPTAATSPSRRFHFEPPPKASGGCRWPSGNCPFYPLTGKLRKIYLCAATSKITAAWILCNAMS
jgi:hypothetical protein